MADKVKISRRKDYREQLKLYLSLSKGMNAKLKKLFRKTARIAEREYIQNKDMYYNFLEDFGSSLYAILAIQYRRVFEAQDRRIQRQRQIKQGEELEQLIEEYIATMAAEKVTRIAETTRNQLRRSIKKGIAEGLSIPNIAKIIRKNGSFAPYRATMIARTETHMAMNFANMEISKKLMFEKPIKQWNASMDLRTRDWHRSMNGDIKDINKPFEVYTPIGGGSFAMKEMMHVGDPSGGAANVVNCRCVQLTYDSKDDIVE